MSRYRYRYSWKIADFIAQGRPLWGELFDIGGPAKSKGLGHSTGAQKKRLSNFLSCVYQISIRLDSMITIYQETPFGKY